MDSQAEITTIVQPAENMKGHARVTSKVKPLPPFSSDRALRCVFGMCVFLEAAFALVFAGRKQSVTRSRENF
jgi:hypothetical protein